MILFCILQLVLGMMMVMTTAGVADAKDSDPPALASPRIIGGRDAAPGRYPYVASMSLGSSHRCGGVIVAPDVVLTTAHCVGFFAHVLLGRYDLSRDEGSEWHVIQEAATHPEYYANSPKESDPHDFALVKMFGETRYQPAKVNRDPLVPAAPGDDLVIVGWGTIDAMDTSEPYDILQDATVQYVSNQECKAITYVADSGNITTLEALVIDVTLCAKGNGTDTCAGDSGGPILEAGNSSLEDIVVGITSSGGDCAGELVPGFYARTSQVVEWMNENVCRLSSNPPADFGCANVTRTPVSSNDNAFLVVEINTDLFPEEIGWILQSTNEFGVNVTYASQPIMSYSNSKTGGAINVTERIEVPNNQLYTFLLLDLNGDGMCCSQGSLTIYQGLDDGSVHVHVNALIALSKSAGEYATAFPFLVGALPTGAPTVTPAPTATAAPSLTPTVARPHVTIEIRFDQYPAETGWILEALVDDQFTLIDAAYPGGFGNYTTGDLVVQKINLLSSRSAPTSYRFVMTDNEGDGMCCNYDSGIARLFAGDPEDGNLLAEFATFFLEEEFFFTEDALVIAAQPATPTQITKVPASPAPTSKALSSPAPTPMVAVTKAPTSSTTTTGEPIHVHSTKTPISPSPTPIAASNEPSSSAWHLTASTLLYLAPIIVLM